MYGAGTSSWITAKAAMVTAAKTAYASKPFALSLLPSLRLERARPAIGQNREARMSLEEESCCYLKASWSTTREARTTETDAVRTSACLSTSPPSQLQYDDMTIGDTVE